MLKKHKKHLCFIFVLSLFLFKVYAGENVNRLMVLHKFDGHIIAIKGNKSLGIRIYQLLIDDTPQGAPVRIGLFDPDTCDLYGEIKDNGRIKHKVVVYLNLEKDLNYKIKINETYYYPRPQIKRSIETQNGEKTLVIEYGLKPENTN